MGCDIHAYAERKTATGEFEVVSIQPIPFGWRDYSVFGYLAGVRNYSSVKPIADPRGLPDDVSSELKEECGFWPDAHSTSWLTIAELEQVDYEQEIIDRRVTRQIDGVLNGSVTGSIEEGKRMSLKKFLNKKFVTEIARLKALKAERIVFWFEK